MSTHKIKLADGTYGFNDTIDNGRIGGGAFSVEIDFSKVNNGAGVGKDEYVVVGKIPGNVKIRQVAATVAIPLELKDDSGDPIELGSATFSPYPVVGVTPGTLLGNCVVAVANNVQGYTAIPSVVEVAVAEDATNTLQVKVSALTDTSAGETSKLVGGVILLTVFADFLFSADDIKNMYPTDQDVMAPDGL